MTATSMRHDSKSILRYWQNNTFARASRFLVHFFAVVARLQRESANFHVLLRSETRENNFPSLFLNFDAVL